MTDKTICLRCGGKMRFLGCEQFQLGRTGWILGDLPNLLSGAMHDLDDPKCPFCQFRFQEV